jgi:hypothetical protein
MLNGSLGLLFRILFCEAIAELIYEARLTNVQGVVIAGLNSLLPGTRATSPLANQTVIVR